MAYYLIFDRDNNLQGYTEDKYKIEEFIKQRPHQKWRIEKVHDNFFTKKARKKLIESNLEIGDYYGVYTLSSEAEDIFSDSNELFAHIFDILETFDHMFPLLKFNKKELEVMGEFALRTIDLRDKLEEGFYHVGKQDKFDEYINVKELVLDMINKETEYHVVSDI